MSDILILGASARAAIHSARRAGLTPHAADLFADRDATAHATVRKCDLADYPDGLERLADSFPAMPWLYTGGLENHPDLVDRIATKRPLWGNNSAAIRSARDLRQPWVWFDEGSRIPLAPEDVGADGVSRWLRKSYRSSGGLGVSWANDLMPRPGTYLQEFVPGRSLSVAARGIGFGDDLIGVTEQLTGTEWLHAEPFHYAGSIGPVLSDARIQEQLVLFVVTVNFGDQISHLWGFDLIDNDGVFSLVDVNPRYTASMEVLEHATGRCAFDGVQRREPRPGVVGKAVYYAPHALRFPEVAAIERAIEVAADPWALPEYADIPAVGSVIDARQPLLSFFERAADAEACRAALKRRAAELDALFARHRVEIAS